MSSHPALAAVNTQTETSIRLAIRFARTNILKIVGISVLVVTPCFWHTNIEAGDLGSHTYNAWLAELISKGQAPGLYVARQYTNVLFDILLAHLGGVLGFAAAEKILVATFVLVYFWSAFAFVAVSSNHPPWSLAPCVFMFAYGWTFQMGFLNYYVSIGLAFAAMAVFWKGKAWDYVVVLALAILIYLAHPIGFLWFVGGSTYVRLAEILTGWGRRLLFAAAFLTILVVHFYTSHHYRTHEPVAARFYRFIGADQLVLYGLRYRGLALAFLLLCVAAVGAGVFQFNSVEFRNRVKIPSQLWAALVFAAAMLWEGITVPAYGMGVTFLPERFTSITAVLLLCVVGCARLKGWMTVALSALAIVFFFWMYQDTGVLNRMEKQALLLVGTLPSGSRVVETIWTLPGSRVAALQLVDRPCIGRCFDFSNYEPSTRQFRIRCAVKSAIVVSKAADGLAMREGRYLVKAEDLPLAEIYQCDERDLGKLCLRELVAGESTGRLGYQPRPSP